MLDIQNIIMERIPKIPWEQFFLSGLRVAGIFTAILVISFVIKKVLRRMECRIKEQREDFHHQESAKRLETIFQLARQAIVVSMWAVGILMILKEIGVEIAPILASAGVVGLAVGFGAQNLVRDMITGFFMILENQIRVGDVVRINSTGGLVERMNMRTIVIRDLTGTVHIFPNGAINSVSNLTQEWSAYVFDVGVGYNSDIDKVMVIMKEVAEELKNDSIFGSMIIESPEILGLDRLGESSLIIRGRIKTQPIKQWEVGREFLRRLKKRFDIEGIEIPFPQRTLTMSPEVRGMFEGLPKA